VVSRQEIINLLHEWVSSDVSKSDIANVLWAMEKARIDSKIILYLKEQRRAEEKDRNSPNWVRV
jgi:hypothetical protein